MPAATSYRYRVVDVFTQTPLEGNPLAVFPESHGLDDLTMQRIARELNLSETVFVVPVTRPDCAAAIRIFTPFREMQFAGHPTVGASFVLLDEGLVAKGSRSFALEEKIGAVPIRVEEANGSMIWLTTPPIEPGAKFERKVCAEALGLEQQAILEVQPQIVSAGNPTLFIGLQNVEAVDRAWLDSGGMRKLRANGENGSFCVFVFTPTDKGAYSRMFAPEYGVAEDPATGSSTGPLAYFMMRNKLFTGNGGRQFVSEQGTKMGRRSLLFIKVLNENGKEEIAVGGYVTPIIEAVLRL